MGAGSEPSAEKGVQEVGLAAQNLSLGQGVEAPDLHPTRQRVGEFRNQKHVRRSSEEESSGRSLAIHRSLEGREDPWGALDLVENRPLRQVANEAHGISCGRSQGHIVVEAQVGIALPPSHHLCQGRLPALAGSVDQDHGRVRQRFNQALFRETGVERGIYHAANCKITPRLIARIMFVQMQAYGSGHPEIQVLLKHNVYPSGKGARSPCSAPATSSPSRKKLEGLLP